MQEWNKVGEGLIGTSVEKIVAQWKTLRYHLPILERGPPLESPKRSKSASYQERVRYCQTSVNLSSKNDFWVTQRMRSKANNATQRRESIMETTVSNKSEAIKLEKKLLRSVGKAIADFSMIEEGDKVMVAISGGKDSWGMLHLLEILQKRAPISFELLALHLDQGEPYAPAAEIGEALKKHHTPSMVVRRQLYDIVEEKLQPNQIRCSLCSRLRRGSLYSIAQELGCTKIALGHHRDDLIETLLLNQFYTGRISSMPPKLTSDDGKNVVIRPLCYVPESALVELARHQNFPIFPCQSCDILDSKRGRVKRLLDELSQEIPGLKASLLRSMSNIRPSQLLDHSIWDFSTKKEPEATEVQSADTQQEATDLTATPKTSEPQVENQASL